MKNIISILFLLLFGSLKGQEITILKDTALNRTGIQTIVYFDSSQSANFLYTSTKEVCALYPDIFTQLNTNESAKAVEEFFSFSNYNNSNAIASIALYKNDRPLILSNDSAREITAKLMIMHEGRAATKLRRAFAELKLNFSFKDGKCRIIANDIIVHLVSEYNGTDMPISFTWNELQKQGIPQKHLQEFSDTIIWSTKRFLKAYKHYTSQQKRTPAASSDW